MSNGNGTNYCNGMNNNYKGTNNNGMNNNYKGTNNSYKGTNNNGMNNNYKGINNNGMNYKVKNFNANSTHANANANSTHANANSTNANSTNINSYQYILDRFPFIKLSYDKILHTKVYTELYSVIPKGNKYYLWITYKEGNNVCLLLSIGKTGVIQNVECYSLCFSDCLALGQGTIFYGTMFEVEGVKHFSCEDIYYYKGKKIEMMNCITKLNLLNEICTYHIQPKIYSKKSIVFGLPIYTNQVAEAFDTNKKLPYKVYGIRHHLQNGVWSLGMTLVKEKAEAIFKVKANVQQDIYELYCYDKQNSEEMYSIALIPDYKSSVMMNSLFRNIKENHNLDSLEESDDEEEFENVREDKFIIVDKTYYMKCVYHSRFKKWQPLEVFREKTRLITKNEAILLEQ
jgi:hypothetical protein